MASTARRTLQNRYTPLDIASVRKRRLRDEDPEKIEQEKWKKFKIVVEGKFPSSIVHLDISKRTGSGLNLIVAGSTRIDFNQISIPVDSRRRDPLATRTFSRFKNFVRCVSLRSDGKLAAAGDETGLVQVVDTNTRTQLRRLRGHNGPVHACSFPPHRAGYVLSGGDDTSLKLWDIADGSCSIEVPNAHADSVRCIEPNPSLNQRSEILTFATGSYDGYIKIWEFDVTNKIYNCLNKFLHGHPVESLAFFPGGSLLATAGGPEIKIWDMNGGGKLLHSIQAHMKTVTAVKIAKDGSYIVTGSLDHSVKFHCSATFSVLHSILLEEEITALNTYRTLDGIDILIIGLSDGQWQVRRRLGPSKVESKELQFTELKANTAQYYSRGPQTEPRPDDVVVDTFKWKRSSFLDRQIQNFRFFGTLDKAIKMGPAPAISFIEMLIEQGVLHVAVRNRDEISILPLIRFVNKEFGNDITSTPILLEFMHTILKENPWMYSSNNDQIILVLERLSAQLDNEYAQHQILRELSGIIELISAVAES